MKKINIESYIEDDDYMPKSKFKHKKSKYNDRNDSWEINSKKKRNLHCVCF